MHTYNAAICVVPCVW